MHELSTVSYVIHAVEKVCAENQASHVEAVTLEVGEVSGIVPEFLADCWEWACRRSELLKGAEMIVEAVEAVSVCEGCEETYSTTKAGRICPFCGSPETYLLTGDQYTIKSIRISC